MPNLVPFPTTHLGSGPLALERLFDAHHRLVYGAAWRVTGNAADAEDVLQTVFLRLAGRDLSADLIENPEGYLRRAAVNEKDRSSFAGQKSAGTGLPSARKLKRSQGELNRRKRSVMGIEC